MYNDTITLFNHYTSPAGDIWYPVILKGVQATQDRGYIMKVYGTDSADSVSIHVRYSKNSEGQLVVGDRVYLSPKEWADVLNDDKYNYITFQGGGSFDCVMFGDYGSEEPIYDDDYKTGFYAYLNRAYDSVYAISSVSGPFGAIPHFELLGK